MSVEQIINVPENGEVILHLPDALKKSKRIKIVVSMIDEEWEQKVLMFENAPQDKEFMADLYEVHNNFERVEGPLE